MLPLAQMPSFAKPCSKLLNLDFGGQVGASIPDHGIYYACDVHKDIFSGKVRAGAVWMEGWWKVGHFSSSLQTLIYAGRQAARETHCQGKDRSTFNFLA